MKKNETIKRIAGVLFVLILVGLAIVKMGDFLAPNSSWDSINSIKAFHSLEENSLDVIAFGPSRAWKGLASNVLTDDYGLKTYNYGGNWQAANTMLLFLRDSFRTQTPKYVLIETSTIQTLLQDINMEGQIYYTRAISDFPGKREYLKECFGDRIDRYLSYYFPLFMFHDNWINVEKANFTAGKPISYYLQTGGYEEDASVYSIWPADPTDDEQYELPEDSLRVLDDMTSICREHGTTVIFFTSLYWGDYNYSDAMKEYAAENDCYYINMFEVADEMGIDWTTDFRDTQHFNDSGSRKAADYLGRFIESISGR